MLTNIKLFFTGSGLLLLLVFSRSFAANPPVKTLLTDSILAQIDTSMGGILGICVYSLKYNRYELNINDTLSFSPASCLKLLVTASAFDHFPVNYFPETSVKMQGSKKGKIFYGNINIKGGGDPNISGRYFPDALTVLKTWVQNIQNLGIDSIIGEVIVRDDIFPGPRKPLVWKKRHFDRWYGAEISAVSFNDNCYNIKFFPGEKENDPVIAEFDPDVGYTKILNTALTVPGNKRKLKYILHPDSNIVTVTGTFGLNAGETSRTFPIRNPPGFLKKAFLHVMAEKGLPMAASSPGKKKLKTYKTWKYHTVPLTNILEDVNQRSQNLHAEMVLRLLGKRVNDSGTKESGIAAEKNFLNRMGIDTSALVLVDGSGLSHLNRVTPRDMTQLLTAMARHRYAHDYITSLATPGLHGAHPGRLKELQKYIKMKTGFINDVQGLCGYIFSGNNTDTLAVSVFLNNYTIPHKEAASFVDSIMQKIVLWYNKEQMALDKADSYYAAPDIPPLYHDRLIYFSNKLKNLAYYDGPTGEGRFAGPDTNPAFDIKRFDCVTYIETVMGLAMSGSSQSLLNNILKIRYYDSIPDFMTRKHFFIEDWIKKSTQYVKILRFPDDTTQTRKTGKKKFFKSRKIKWSHKDPVTELSYVPYSKALTMMDNWTYGRRFLGTAFVTKKLKWLWVTHTGFLDATQSSKPILRHASSRKGRVVEENFKKYLKNRKSSISGVVFFDFEEQEVK